MQKFKGWFQAQRSQKMIFSYPPIQPSVIQPGFTSPIGDSHPFHKLASSFKHVLTLTRIASPLAAWKQPHKSVQLRLPISSSRFPKSRRGEPNNQLPPRSTPNRPPLRLHPPHLPSTDPRLQARYARRKMCKRSSIQSGTTT